MANKVLIIGAGIAGLSAANKLTGSGFEVEIYDKGKGIGGRTASRGVQVNGSYEGNFDFGTQFFTAREPEFIDFTVSLVKNNIVRKWFGEGDYAKYCGVKSMRSAAEYMSRNLTINTGIRIVKIEANKSGWHIFDENGNEYVGEHLIITPPAPQTVELLNKSGLYMPDLILSKLENVNYQPCIAMLMLIEGKSKVPEPGFAMVEYNGIASITDNNQKGINNDYLAFTLHSTGEYAEENWDADTEKLSQELTEAAGDYYSGKVIGIHIHKWKYAKTIKYVNDGCLYTDTPRHTLFAGDAFHSPRLEGAFMSGLKAAERIISLS